MLNRLGAHNAAGSWASVNVFRSQKNDGISLDDPPSFLKGIRMNTSYEEPRRLYLEYCAAKAENSRPNSAQGIFSQIPRLALGFPLDEEYLKGAIDFVCSNKDASDFTVGGLVRILYLYPNSSLVSERQKKDIEECLLDFKYWWNEPGRDSRGYYTENHQIIFHSGQLLAGQLFKDRTFRNNQQYGEWHQKHALSLIGRWMDWRFRLGFSEWLSNNYYDADCLALANLLDFAGDPVIRSRAGLLIDTLMFEMALHNYRGTFGSTHGRTYARFIEGGCHELSANTIKMMFGSGFFSGISMGAVSLATSSYRCPEIIQHIATDYSKPLVSRQRQSIDIDDAFQYGLSYSRELDVNLYWGIQDFTHPLILDLSHKVSKKYGTRLHGDFDKYRHIFEQQMKLHGRIVNHQLNPKALTEVNIETYRTPEYMLSCAQRFRPGCLGYQQHIWQATLGTDAVVFTNNPGSFRAGTRPDYWAGNGVMPNAAQYKNVLICIYQIPEINPLLSSVKADMNDADDLLPNETKRELIPLSHAYFPKTAFDEVVEKNQWIFGRKKNGYIALYSQKPTQWNLWKGKELDVVASSRDNIWICELGSKDTWGAFSNFVEAITGKEVEVENQNVKYQSPSQGEITYGWSAPFRVNGENISLRYHLRFDNPYCQNEFASNMIVIQKDHEKLILDFQNAKKEIIKI